MGSNRQRFVSFTYLTANDVSYSRFLKLDPLTGNVLTSFQLAKMSTGFNLKAYQIYFVSNDELIISVDGSQTYNKFGLTSSSFQDTMILKVNVTTRTIVSSSTWDVQNGMEYSTTIEFENDTIYHFGMKDDKYLFVKKHNLTTLDTVVNQNSIYKIDFHS